MGHEDADANSKDRVAEAAENIRLLAETVLGRLHGLESRKAVERIIRLAKDLEKDQRGRPAAG
jgi:predicted ArsR family transcriptional regulator